jgi:hypothetical protein
MILSLSVHESEHTLKSDTAWAYTRLACIGCLQNLLPTSTIPVQVGRIDRDAYFVRPSCIPARGCHYPSRPCISQRHDGITWNMCPLVACSLVARFPSFATKKQQQQHANSTACGT